MTTNNVCMCFFNQASQLSTNSYLQWLPTPGKPEQLWANCALPNATPNHGQLWYSLESNQSVCSDTSSSEMRCHSGVQDVAPFAALIALINKSWQKWSLNWHFWLLSSVLSGHTEHQNCHQEIKKTVFAFGEDSTLNGFDCWAACNTVLCSIIFHYYHLLCLCSAGFFLHQSYILQVDSEKLCH